MARGGVLGGYYNSGTDIVRAHVQWRAPPSPVLPGVASSRTEADGIGGGARQLSVGRGREAAAYALADAALADLARMSCAATVCMRARAHSVSTSSTLMTCVLPAV